MLQFVIVVHEVFLTSDLELQVIQRVYLDCPQRCFHVAFTTSVLNVKYEVEHLGKGLLGTRSSLKIE